MIVTFIQIVGLWFLAAIALELFAVYAEQAGAARKAEERGQSGFGAFALMILTTLTPALLFLHAFFLTHGAPSMIRVAAIGLVTASVIFGAIVGRLVGMGWEDGARVMRTLALPLGLAAFVLAIYVTRPSLIALADLFNGEIITLPVTPI